MTQEVKSHFFAVRTTGGQEKVVLGLLENRIKLKKLNLQSVLLLENLKGYVVIEAIDANAAFDALQGMRHIRGQLRGELQFKDIEGYLVKKSTVSELSVDQVRLKASSVPKSQKARNKNYKYTWVLFLNGKSKTDAKGYGKHYQACKEIR